LAYKRVETVENWLDRAENMGEVIIDSFLAGIILSS